MVLMRIPLDSVEFVVVRDSRFRRCPACSFASAASFNQLAVNLLGLPPTPTTAPFPATTILNSLCVGADARCSLSLLLHSPSLLPWRQTRFNHIVIALPLPPAYPPDLSKVTSFSQHPRAPTTFNRITQFNIGHSPSPPLAPPPSTFPVPLASAIGFSPFAQILPFSDPSSHLLAAPPPPVAFSLAVACAIGPPGPVAVPPPAGNPPTGQPGLEIVCANQCEQNCEILAPSCRIRCTRRLGLPHVPATNIHKCDACSAAMSDALDHCHGNVEDVCNYLFRGFLPPNSPASPPAQIPPQQQSSHAPSHQAGRFAHWPPTPIPLLSPSLARVPPIPAPVPIFIKPFICCILACCGIGWRVH